MAVRGILFDLDGTLVDRAESISHFCRELGHTFAQDLREIKEEALFHIVSGADAQGYRQKDEVFRLLVSNLPWMRIPGVDEVRDFWEAFFPRCTRPMAGAYEVLDSLWNRKIKMGIVTNGNTDSQEAKIDRLDFRAYMDTVIISEAVMVAKPDARVFRIALDEMALQPGEVLFVGDHPVNDIAGAQGVGMAGIWMKGHLPWPENRELPRRVITHLSGLLPFIEKDHEN